MNDDSVHKPELPGVRTLAKDTPEKRPGFGFGGVKLTSPEESDHATDKAIAHSGGRLASGKETFDIERAFNDESVQEGTIVTDRKRRRVTTRAMLKSAWNEWWGSTKSSVEATVDKFEFLKPKEEPTVEVAEKRATILQEAAQYAKQAPRDDHAIVIEKVRTFARDAETATGKPFTIKEPATKVGSHWSKPRDVEQTPAEKPESIPTLDLRTTAVATDVKHSKAPLTTYIPQPQAQKIAAPKIVVTEKPAISSMRTPKKMPGKQLAEKPSGWTFFKDEKPVSVDLREKVSGPRPEITAIPRMDTRQLPIAPRVREAMPDAPPTASVQVEKKVMPPIEPTISTSPVMLEESMEPRERVRPLVESKPVTPKQRHLLTALFSVPRALIFGAIIVVGGGLGVLAALFILDTKEDMPIVETIPVTVPSFVETDADIPLPLGSTKTVFFQALQNEMGIDHGTVVQYYPTITESAVTKPATTDAIMRTLALEAPSSFVRVLSSAMMFGGVRGEQNEPFIIFQSTNFDTAFAGLLAWEKTMSRDLSPLFGEPLDGRAFADALRSNRSIRILADENGEERLLYAFVNRDLIIITTSTTALAKLIERVE